MLSSALTYDVVDAYRAAIAVSADGRDEVFDERWLVLGSGLQAALLVSGAERNSYLESVIRAVALSEAQESTPAHHDLSERLASLVASVAEEAERKSSYSVAVVILETAGLLLPPSAGVHYGRFLAQYGRIMRKIGEFEDALHVYAHVGDLAEKLSSNELVARALIGRACVARERGNYPEARRLFEQVLELSDSSPSISALRVLAHQGLLINAALARDFDRALAHGHLAFQAAPAGSERRTEILISLASLSHDAGHYEAALNGHLSGAALTTSDSVRLTALGGAAVAAAHLGRRALVDRAAATGVRLSKAISNSYATADMERAFAEAYIRLGDVGRAQSFLNSARVRAEAGGFYEIQHELEAISNIRSTSSEASTTVLSENAMNAIRELEGGNAEGLLELVSDGRRA